MFTKTIPNFSLTQICRSGQCFRMEDAGGGMFRIPAGGRCLEVRQQGEECQFFCREEEYETFWKNYFDLEQDYAFFMKRIDPEDRYLSAAAAFGSGIRILRQDLWETIVSFLISQQNNIVRIRRCIRNICEAYGENCGTHFAFPRPEALAGLSEDALKECNLGYRSKYVVRAAQSVVSGRTDLEAVSAMSYSEAKEELLGLFGVGEKVADCICLFGLHQLQAFPVDTHISQALQKHYKEGFPFERYAGTEGVLQQYIFYYELFGGAKKAR